MKVKISELRAAINKFLTEALAEIEQEDVDRLRRAKDGYGETEFEEDVDRLRRAADGYGETPFEEGSLATPPPSPQSQRPPKRDKSQMQGVGPRPTMATAFGDEPKKEATEDDWYIKQNRQPLRNPNEDEAGVHKDDKVDWDAFIAKKRQEKGIKFPQEASIATAPPQAQSIKGPKKDKSQMQGVGPRPTMANAFDDLGSKKKSEASLNPNITAELPPEEKGSSSEADAEFQKALKDKMRQMNKEKIARTAKDHQMQMGQDGWKFEQDPSGNWMAKPPRKTEATAPSDDEEEFIKKNTADFKKRYGKAYKDRLYSKAKEKYRK